MIYEGSCLYIIEIKVSFIIKLLQTLFFDSDFYQTSVCPIQFAEGWA